MILTALLALAGCGDLGRDELARGVRSLSALAAEGTVLAKAVRDDDTKATYARVQAGALSDDADHEAQKLADAGAPAAVVELASQLDEALGTLVTYPGDEARAAEVVVQLGRIHAGLERQ